MMIRVAARASPLSRAQVEEVLQELHPNVEFSMTWVETTGDKDLHTSLRTLPRNDFFTKELDEMLLQGSCDVAIHSAKDLPIPLPKGLRCVALTKGVDPRDVLVLRAGVSLDTLPLHAKIGTSSIRREATIKSLRPDLECRDIRGTIDKRLQKLFSNEIDGVVIAYAALIRLKKLHLHFILLDGPTAKYQGRLAVVARHQNEEMKQFFSAIDCSKKLYIGLDPPPGMVPRMVHCPFIETILTRSSLTGLLEATHLLFTSKMGVRYLMQALDNLSTIIKMPCLSVGKATTACLESFGFKEIFTAQEETSEGVIALIDALHLHKAHIFWPHSAQSRRAIPDFLHAEQIRLSESILYDTVAKRPDPLPDLDDFDEIFFSSPTTVDAFLSFFGSLPEETWIATQGSTTFDYVKMRLPGTLKEA